MTIPMRIPTTIGSDEDHWDPNDDKRLTAWEAAQHLIYRLERGGEQSAADLLSQLGSLSEIVRDLAYRLYTICERKGWAQEALAYNMLVVAWPRIKEMGRKQSKQEKFI
jgi:putative DNA methylase